MGGLTREEKKQEMSSYINSNIDVASIEKVGENRFRSFGLVLRRKKDRRIKFNKVLEYRKDWRRIRLKNRWFDVIECDM